jgi:AraC family transcriptional regulator
MELRLMQTGTVLKTWDISGLLLMEAVYAPKLEVPKHSHQQANFCIALEGICTERFGEKTREYKPFTLDFLPPDTPHSLIFHAAEVRCFTMDIAPRWLERAREYSLLVDSSVHCYSGVLAELFMRLYKEVTWMDEASPLAIEGLALEMLAEVSRRRIVTRESRNAQWLRQVKDLLHAQFSEPPDLTGIAEAVGVHPVHLTREFRKQFHCTVGEYIRQLRVEYACRQLSSSSTALAEIASTAGFSDQSHFSRTFKRQIGMTPAQYRAISRAR